MKKITKAIVAVIALVLVFSAGTVFAVANTETISVLLNRGIRINYNGVEQTFTDVTGTRVYPISYNGTTYLPIRAVSNMLGLNVEWNGETNTVDLGTKEMQPTKLVDQTHTKGTQNNYTITDKNALTVSGSDANQEFSSGIEYLMKAGITTGSWTYAQYFDCAGYSELSFTVWADADATAYIYDQDGAVLTSFSVKAGQLLDKTVMLNGAKQVSLQGKGPSVFTTNIIRFYDPVLK